MKKGFIYQTYTEIKKILNNAFVLIIVGLLLIISFTIPFLQKVQNDKRLSNYKKEKEGSIIVKGQRISKDNPFFYDLNQFNETKLSFEKNAYTKADDLVLEVLDIMLSELLYSAEEITAYEDYRFYLVYDKKNILLDKFIFENMEKYNVSDMVKMLDALHFGMPKEHLQRQYYNLEEKEKIKRLENIDFKLEMIHNIEEKNDYKQYYRDKIIEAKKEIEEWTINIKALEKDILEHPENEEMYGREIDNYNKNIITRMEIEIYYFNYSIENDIEPNYLNWRYNAVEDKKQAAYQLMGEIVSQNEFEQNEALRQLYKSYNIYKKNMQNYLNEATKKMLIAEKSLDTKKPDMKYVPGGSRSKVTEFLWYSLIIAMFGIIIGGGLISKEFKTGTIRLLLIRPKTRLKIILSKFFALVAICFLLYLAAALFSIIANGILFSFEDYTYPNYTLVGGEDGVNFFADYASKFLICFVSIFFACAMAYSLSVLTKNAAISVVVPFVLIAGSLVCMFFITENMQNPSSVKWLVYTPLPYINLFIYYINIWQEFQPRFDLGIPMMIGITSVVIAVSSIMFKSCDITN